MSVKLFPVAVAIACAASGLAPAKFATAADTGETIIGAKAYLDLTNIDQTSDGVPTDASGTGFDIKRFYLAVSHKFDETWSANLTTDVNYVSNDNETQLFVKKAFFQAHFSDAFVLRAGSADLPWIPFVEDLYGYRWVEPLVDERTRFATSADWGVHALGNFAAGKVNYDVAAINGNGYKNPSRSKRMDYAARIGFAPITGLMIAAGVQTGYRGLETENVTPLHTATRTDFVAAYVQPKFRVGAQYFEAKNWNQVLTAETDKADGYSLWGTYAIVKSRMAVFARYDDVTPSKTLQPDLENTYFNVGLDYAPRPMVDIALVYKQSRVDNGVFTTVNGTIGGTNQGKYDEIGIWTQVQF
jgi:hypothetical protein